MIKVQILENVRPVSSLSNERIQFQLEQADIVFGLDTASNNKIAVFFGLDKIRQNKHKPTKYKVISFLYNSNTDELEYLVAAVRALKGYDCYGQLSNLTLEEQQDMLVRIVHWLIVE